MPRLIAMVISATEGLMGSSAGVQVQAAESLDARARHAPTLRLGVRVPP
jgi:hypothetical protein